MKWKKSLVTLGDDAKIKRYKRKWKLKDGEVIQRMISEFEEKNDTPI